MTWDESIWDLFDEIDARRRAHRRRHDEAFRALDPRTATATDPASVDAWQRYCDATASLEATLVELERLLWRL